MARLLLLILLIGGVGLALIVARLAQGPLSVDFLKPLIEAELSSPDLKIELDRATVAFDRHERSIDIIVHQMRVRNGSGELLAALPEAALGLSVKAAFRGLVAPTHLVLHQPKVFIVRESDGRFRVAVGGQDQGSSPFLERLGEDLARPPDGDRAWGYLRELTVRDALLVVEDRLLGLTWHTEHAAISARRDVNGIVGDVALAIDQQGRSGELHADLRYATADQRLGAEISISGLQPASLAASIPALAPLGALRFPISGTAHASLDFAKFQLEGSRVDLSLGEGRIEHPELPEGRVPVKGGQLRANWDPERHRLRMENLALDLGGPSLDVTATVDGLDPLAGAAGEIVVNADLRAAKVMLDDLPRLWPTKLAKNSRDWVLENIRDGAAEEAAATLRLTVPAGGGAQPRLDEFVGTMRFRDLTVHYLRPLPPVRGVNGTGRFDKAHFDLFPASGTLLGVKVTGGTIALSQLDTNDERIAIDLPISGPVRDVMTVIDTKPFEYAKEIGIEPARVSGDATGRLSFRFPLVKDLTFDHVELAVDAKVAAVGIQKLVFDSDLSDGGFDLRLDRKGLQMQGGGKLAGVPAAASISHLFKPPKDGPQTRYTVWAVVDREGRRRLDLDLLPDNTDGPVAVDVTVTEQSGKRREAQLALGLKDARIGEPRLGYDKPPGQPAQARLVIEMQDDRVLRARDIAISGPKLDIQGTLTFAGRDNQLQRAEVKRLVAGRTELSGLVARMPAGGWRFDAQGRAIDISGLMEDKSKPADKKEQQTLSIDARFDRVFLAGDREARQLSAQLLREGKEWQNARIDAVLGQDGKLALRFGQAAGGRTLTISSTDFGATLAAFGIMKSIHGGRLEVTGQADDRGPVRVVRGHVEGTDWRMLNAPGFAKLLSVASLTSMASLLSGDGLPFTRLTGDFEYTDGKMKLSNTRAYGGAIGITATGTIDTDADTIDLEGTLVPAYTINTLLGNIPILGKLLMGGEGQGLFGVNYYASGPASDPKVSINPLSVLAPGFLRRLFFFDAPNPDLPSEPQPPKLGGN